MADISESNYPVKTPIGARLTRELVDDVAQVLEARGFPPLSAQDHGGIDHLIDRQSRAADVAAPTGSEPPQ